MKTLFLIFCLLLISSASFADGTEFSEDTSYAALNNPLQKIMLDAETEALEQKRAERAEGEEIFALAESIEVSSPTDELNRLVEEVEALKSKVVVTKQNTLATKNPRAQKKIGSITYYNYQEGQIYELHAVVDRISDIALQAGELLSNAPVAGDTVRWKIGSTTSGEGAAKKTHIIVKPLEEGIETNLLITTNKRTYHIRALASDWYMPQIAWNYPQEEFERQRVQLERQEAFEPLSFSPEDLRFRYRVEGEESCHWKPLRVFDDGQKTYFQMSKELEAREAPALFILDEDSEPMLTNYRVKGDYYIIDSLFTRAQFRVGKSQKVDIYADDYTPSFFERIF